MKAVRKTIIGGFFFLAMLSILSIVAQTRVTHAQEMFHLSSVELDLWPEFDQATMLVIYRITLPTEIYLPVEVKLRIPAAAGKPNAVAVRQPGGRLVSIAYDQQEDSERNSGISWSWIIFRATMPEVQVEYYDPGLEMNGNAHHFVYVWPGDYAVDAFKVEVQEPVGAEQMRIKPGMVTAKPGTDGLVYYLLDVGSLTVGQTFEIEVDYLKDNHKLSSAYIPVEPSGPLDASTQGRMSIASALPWLLGLLGLLLIVGGGYWYWKSGHEEVKPIYKRVPQSPQTLDETDATKLVTVYCHHCGKRAYSGDRFCRACGTQLRLG